MVTTVVTFGIAIVIISMIAYYSYVATIVTRSVAIVVIEVLVYVDFNIRASYTVVPVFCVVIRPFSLGSMGDMSCRRNKNIVTYGTYLRLGLGCLCTGSMSYGSIGYGTSCVLTYVPVVVCIGSPSFSEAVRLCGSYYCVTNATYYRCRAVAVVSLGSMSYGSIGYGTSCVLTYVPVVVCIGSPSFSEAVRLCGSYYCVTNATYYRCRAVAVVSLGSMSYGSIGYGTSCVLTYVPVVVCIGSPSFSEAVRLCIGCYCVTNATYYRCRAVAIVSLWSMSCYSGVLTACIVTGCVTCVIPCVGLSLNENLLATKLTEYRSFAIAVVLCRLVVALGGGRAGRHIVDNLNVSYVQSAILILSGSCNNNLRVICSSYGVNLIYKFRCGTTYYGYRTVTVSAARQGDDNCLNFCSVRSINCDGSAFLIETNAFCVYAGITGRCALCKYNRYVIV